MKSWLIGSSKACIEGYSSNCKKLLDPNGPWLLATNAPWKNGNSGIKCRGGGGGLQVKSFWLEMGCIRSFMFSTIFDPVVVLYALLKSIFASVLVQNPSWHRVRRDFRIFQVVNVFGEILRPGKILRFVPHMMVWKMYLLSILCIYVQIQ